ncbi:MAG: response regulator transcription factor [Elusimicrobiota bacterium]
MGYRVLVIDDDEEIARLVTVLLKGADWICLWAGTGESGWTQALAAAPDVILLDLNLPGIGGRELCGRIKSEPRLSRVPVIISSADHREVRACLLDRTMAADDFLVKPFEGEVLLARLKKAVGQAG